MTNYSIHPSHVRVDFFKDTGKWYTTEEMIWQGAYEKDTDIHIQFARSLITLLRIDKGGAMYVRLSEMTAVCLEPCHPLAHPLMMKVSYAIEMLQSKP